MTYSPKFLLVPVLFAAMAVAGPALADCAQDIEAVKTVAPTVELNDDDKAKVDAATQAATEKQAAGDEDGCVAEITAAKMVLRIE